MIRLAAALLVLVLAAPMANAQVVVQVAPVAPAPPVVVRPSVRHYHGWYRIKRFFWPHRHHTVVVVPGCPTCCCPSPQPVAPPPAPLPPPPPPAPPAPPIYEALPPLPPPPPPLPPPPPPRRVYVAPAPQVVAAPMPRPEEPFKFFGLGVRGGLTAMGDDSQYFGIGGHLRLRPTRQFAIDLAAERMSSRKGELHRTDVPVTLGGQFYFTRGTLAPFVVADIGINFARARVDGYSLDYDAKQMVEHIGGGLELRLGRHVTLSADARYVARQRIDKEKDTIMPAGAPTYNDATYIAPPAKIGNEHGAEFRLMATLYF